MSTKFWPVLHSLKKSTSLPRREQWRWPLEVTSIRPTCNWRKAARKERVSYKTTANQLRRNRKKNQKLVEPLVFITASRQSHIVRNDVTPGGHSKLKAHNAVFWQPLEDDFDSNGWSFKDQGTVRNWTRCCVLISDFKLVIFFLGCPCPFCIVFTQ